jgi:hypothetical protein
MRLVSVPGRRSQVAGDGDKREVRDPARQPPQEIIGGDQRAEQDKSCPHAGGGALRQRIYQILHAVLRADRTGNGCQYRCKNDRVSDRAPTHVTKDEGKGATGVITEIGHARLISLANAGHPWSGPYNITTPEPPNLSAPTS